jgi:hypothetical protein
MKADELLISAKGLHWREADFWLPITAQCIMKERPTSEEEAGCGAASAPHGLRCAAAALGSNRCARRKNCPLARMTFPPRRQLK